MTFRTLVSALFLAVCLLAPPADAGQLEDARDAYNKGEFAKALALLKPLAESGVAEAQYSIGVIYAFGEGVPLDYAEAMKWFLMAADQSEPMALLNIGTMYIQGYGVSRDVVEADKWFSKAILALNLANDQRCQKLDLKQLREMGDEIMRSPPRESASDTSHLQCVAILQANIKDMIAGMAAIMPTVDEATGNSGSEVEPYCVLEDSDRRYLGAFIAELDPPEGGYVPDSLYECFGPDFKRWY